MRVPSAPIERLFARLRQAGLPEVPERFSVAPLHQEIAAAAAAAIDGLIDVFERVTTRPRWREAVLRDAPEIARHGHGELCFFSAWDFHLPPDRPDRPQLIEFNDNGSGFFVAALVNRVAYEVLGLDGRPDLEPPEALGDFRRSVIARFEDEWRAFPAGARQRPLGEVRVVDAAPALREGRFLRELVLLRDLLREAGFGCALSAPEELVWDGTRLRHAGREVDFVVNRSTDFFWQDDAFAALRAAWRAGAVYAAPNPSTYATRSDKRLLEPLSRADRDAELGIRPEERRVLAEHVPETRVVRPENVEELAARKRDWVFKPVQGFAGRGLLPSAQVGRTRLRRLLEKGEGYVAQRRVAKPSLRGPGPDGAAVELWTDVRVWAHRGRRLWVSGRASRRPDRLDLSPPGGWLPTYFEREHASATAP
jgi:hypothetical protein